MSKLNIRYKTDNDTDITEFEWVDEEVGKLVSSRGLASLVTIFKLYDMEGVRRVGVMY